MKQHQFVRLNNERWQNFEALCLGDASALPEDFAQQYRRICNELALARSRHYSPALIDKLNKLVQLGQQGLYKNEGISFKYLIQEFQQTFGQALYENRYYLWSALAAFWGLALVAFTWVLINPEAVYHFLDVNSVKTLESMYDPAGTVQSTARLADSDLLMFGVYIYNNIGIAFQMFAGGLLFCIGALLPLLFNSFYFGAIAAHIINIGYSETFFSFVVTHSSFELTAIIIAGAAGCKLGYQLINPGKYVRAYALKKASKSVLPLIIGAFLMLVLAAFIEAFWSSREMPSLIKYSVGSICWFYVLLRLYRGSRYGT
jgi:uncharacterized membrane protein SpoIIM required for sporulation